MRGGGVDNPLLFTHPLALGLGGITKILSISEYITYIMAMYALKVKGCVIPVLS